MRSAAVHAFDCHPIGGVGQFGIATGNGRIVAMANRKGTPATPFELKDIHGHVHRLEQHARRWLLLVFHRHLA
jgi:hypothetical protein